jgi:glycosyltransferase involved in cell wall biosynthesis
MKPYPRKHYGLPEKKFLFLYIFDFNSSVARKNPMATVQAFKQAFKPSDSTVGLVLKTMNTKPNNPEWQAFLKECQTDKRIQLITETLDRPEVLGLINACDAYVSLHRAEGFGRTMAEAMLLIKPVIATNYSGNIDFSTNYLVSPIDYKLVKLKEFDYQWISIDDQAEWAEILVVDASKKLIFIRNKHTSYEANSLQFHNFEFSVEKIANLIKKYLR